MIEEKTEFNVILLEKNHSVVDHSNLEQNFPEVLLSQSRRLYLCLLSQLLLFRGCLSEHKNSFLYHPLLSHISEKGYISLSNQDSCASAGHEQKFTGDGGGGGDILQNSKQLCFWHILFTLHPHSQKY